MIRKTIRLFSILLVVMLSLTIVSCEQNNDLNINKLKKIVENSVDYTNFFELENTVSFKNSYSLLLNSPANIFLNDKNELVWAELDGTIYFFNIDGKLLKKEKRIGNGPGEYSEITDIYQDNNMNYMIYDWGARKINRYTSKFAYHTSFNTGATLFKKSVFLNKKLYVLTEGLSSYDTTCITMLDSQGKIVGNWGNKPKTASVQDFLRGGGITSDNTQHIYYGYILDYRIWKSDSLGNFVSVFKEKPEYFIDTNEDELLKKTSFQQIEYAQSIVRMTGLFYLKPNILLQQFSLYHKKIGLKFFIEAWSIVGEKLYSFIIPYEIISVKNNKIITVECNFENLNKDNKTDHIVRIYKLKE